MTRELLEEAVKKCCESLINNDNYQGVDAVHDIMMAIDAYGEANGKNILQNSSSGGLKQFKCYHYNYEWKGDGQGGNLKYCNDCKCYV